MLSQACFAPIAAINACSHGNHHPLRRESDLKTMLGYHEDGDMTVSLCLTFLTSSTLAHRIVLDLRFFQSSISLPFALGFPQHYDFTGSIHLEPAH